MQITVASGIFHPEPGGPATYLYHLLPALQARGHSLRVLTFGESTAAGYPYPLRRIPRRALPVRMADYALAAWQATRDADLLFVNSLGLPLAATRGLPRVLKVVGDRAWERAVNRGWIAPSTDVDAFQDRRYNWRVALLQRQRAGEVRRADRVIVPSEYLRRMVIGWGAAPERVEVIYNALPGGLGINLSEAEARAQLDLPAGPLLVTAARLVPWKGVDHLLRALAQAPDVHLLVAGDGPDEARLQALAAEGAAGRVTFLGRVPRDRLAVLLRAADYSVVYSGYEGLSHTVLESLQAGTPVIASAKGGNPELIAHDVNGLLVPYPDAGALGAAIRSAFTGDTRARLAANTAHGLERFAWATLVERTAALLESVCTS